MNIHCTPEQQQQKKTRKKNLKWCAGCWEKRNETKKNSKNNMCAYINRRRRRIYIHLKHPFPKVKFEYFHFFSFEKKNQQNPKKNIAFFPLSRTDCSSILVVWVVVWGSFILFFIFYISSSSRFTSSTIFFVA